MRAENTRRPTATEDGLILGGGVRVYDGGCKQARVVYNHPTTLQQPRVASYKESLGYRALQLRLYRQDARNTSRRRRFVVVKCFTRRWTT